jgi:hypothetical protein
MDSQKPDDQTPPTESDEIEFNADGSVVGEEAENKLTCAQCETDIPAGQEVHTQNSVFCEPCFTQIKSILEESVAQQSLGINYLGAVLGGLGGGVLGALIWWGFVVLTEIQFGLVAIVIGWAVGKGVVLFSGHKKSLPLQLISVLLAFVSYGMATYWVSRTFVNEYYAEQGLEVTLPLIPPVALYLDVVISGFELFDLIFLAIVLFQAWKMPAPVKLNT